MISLVTPQIINRPQLLSYLKAGALCRMHFRSFGYGRYHLIPDFIFHKPLNLISKHFWRTTFFAPIYTPKIDYPEMATRFSHSRVRESF